MKVDLDKYDVEALSDVVDELSDLRDYYVGVVAKIMRINGQLLMEDRPEVIELMQAEITDVSDAYSENMPQLIEDLADAMRKLPRKMTQRYLHDLIRDILPAPLISSIKRKDHTLDL